MCGYDFFISRPRHTGTRHICPLLENYSRDAQVDQISVLDELVLLDGPRLLFLILHGLRRRSRVRRRSHGKTDEN